VLDIIISNRGKKEELVCKRGLWGEVDGLCDRKEYNNREGES
jgi:hypothetical protein